MASFHPKKTRPAGECGWALPNHLCRAASFPKRHPTLEPKTDQAAAVPRPPAFTFHVKSILNGRDNNGRPPSRTSVNSIFAILAHRSSPLNPPLRTTLRHAPQLPTNCATGRIGRRQTRFLAVAAAAARATQPGTHPRYAGTPSIPSYQPRRHPKTSAVPAAAATLAADAVRTSDRKPRRPRWPGMVARPIVSLLEIKYNIFVCLHVSLHIAVGKGR